MLCVSTIDLTLSRGVWDGENVNYFPRTVELIKELQVPSCEAFFAKQGHYTYIIIIYFNICRCTAPRSGIAPHSDKNNFIITSHLGLDGKPTTYSITQTDFHINYTY
jgi:hypothetical protein